MTSRFVCGHHVNDRLLGISLLSHDGCPEDIIQKVTMLNNCFCYSPLYVMIGCCVCERKKSRAMPLTDDVTTGNLIWITSSLPQQVMNGRTLVVVVVVFFSLYTQQQQTTVYNFSFLSFIPSFLPSHTNPLGDFLYTHTHTHKEERREEEERKVERERKKEKEKIYKSQKRKINPLGIYGPLLLLIDLAMSLLQGTEESFPPFFFSLSLFSFLSRLFIWWQTLRSF